jgi:hypothetical protein
VYITAINNAKSLSLLNVYALKADFKELILVDQKFISKNDVTPIISQPKNKTNKLPLITSTTMLITNKFISNDKRSILGS